MKGAAIAVTLVVALFIGLGTTSATEPIVPPVQYEQFCDSQKISGTGIIDVGTSIMDKKIALEYGNFMAGDGDIEFDQGHSYSQNADKIKRDVSSVNGGNGSNLNLYETEKLTYKGQAPLTGEKYLKSKEFYGGIGADIQEHFSVNEMEKDQKTFFVSTAPSISFKQYNPPTIFIPIVNPYSANMSEPNSRIYPVIAYNPPSVAIPRTPVQLLKDLKDAGSDQTKVAELMADNPTHLLGIETKNSFNGTWGTDATWHKIFYKDIKAHEMFTGTFETDKTIKFHENPVPEEESQANCEGFDC